MDSLLENQTWELTKLLIGKKALHNKWVYRIKNEHDSSKCYKARLVVKGFQQKKGHWLLRNIFSSCEDVNNQTGTGNGGYRKFTSWTVRCEDGIPSWWLEGRHLHDSARRVHCSRTIESSLQTEKELIWPKISFKTVVQEIWQFYAQNWIQETWSWSLLLC